MSSAQSDIASYSTLALLRDVRELIRPYRFRFLAATVLRMTGDIVRLYVAYALSRVITILTEPASVADPATSIGWYVGGAGAALLIHILCRESAKFIGYQVAGRVSLDAQVRTLRHLFSLDLAWHEHENSGNKIKRMQKGGEGLERILRIWITNLIEVGVNFVGIILIIAAFDWRVSALIVGFMVVYYLLSLVITGRAARMEYAVNAHEEVFHGIAFEAVNNVRSVKVLGMFTPLIARISEQAKIVFSSIRERILWFRIRELVLAITGHGFFMSVIAVIAWSVLRGQSSVGFLVLFMEYFRKIWENVNELSQVTQDFFVAKVNVLRMMHILREPIGIDAESGKEDFPEDWDAIEIRHLSFSYPGGSPVLKDVSFEVRRGEKIGIVGISGAGKSTLFKLLLKEHEHYQGDIRIGGVSVRDIRRSSFFRYSAVVLQDTEVFNFSLRDNITLANADHADDPGLLQKAVQVSHVTDFLQKLPEGIDTMIGEKGVKLSGGEKQRVGIARAVFKEPQILFLDEATSHLDLESEEKIRDSLHCFFQSVTAIVIAHRLSTIKEMDRILVVENGVIIESGPFQELYAKKGRFWELWEKQKF